MSTENSGAAEIFLTLLKEVRDEQKNLAAAFSKHAGDEQKLETALNEHIKESRERHAEIITGFPGGDLDGHRRYHATVIEARELRNKLVRECLINAAKVGSLAAIVWLIHAIWISIKMEFKI